MAGTYLGDRVASVTGDFPAPASDGTPYSAAYSAQLCGPDGSPLVWSVAPVPVVETARPADTDTTTTTPGWSVGASSVTRTWTPRQWSATELSTRAERGARLDSIEARLARIEARLWPPAAPDAPASDAAPWDPDATYAVDDLVADLGVTYRCLVAHGPERLGTWRPGPATPTIWAVA